jgi:hypothetical protein
MHIKPEVTIAVQTQVLSVFSTLVAAGGYVSRGALQPKAVVAWVHACWSWCASVHTLSLLPFPVPSLRTSSSVNST